MKADEGLKRDGDLGGHGGVSKGWTWFSEDGDVGFGSVL